MATGHLKKTDSLLAARCAATASAGAAVIHFAVTPMHWRDWVPSGVFFAALATFQLLWALIAWSRPNAVVLTAGIAANAGAATLWVMSCISGPPVGPSAGEPEAVGAAGIAVLLLQCYVVMGSAWAWSRRYEPQEVSGFGRAMVLMGANTVMAGAVAVGLVASLQGHHHHHHGGSMEAQGDHHGGHEAHMGGYEMNMDGGVPMEGHHHQPGDGSVPSSAPLPEEALPVTDMALDTDGDHDHAAAVVPPPAPATAPVPAAAPTNTAPESGESVSPPSDSDAEPDGHEHHHDD